MPFDQTLPQDVQNLLTLADALERPMPKGFEWCFGAVCNETDCGTAGCAIGLAAHMGLYEGGWDITESVKRATGMTELQVRNVFMNGYDKEDYYPCGTDGVTPAMVAKELRRIATEKMTG